MKLKKPLTVSEQIQKLKAHNISVNNEEKARDILSRVNYYRLTGYALQFRKSAEDSTCKEAQSLNKIYFKKF